MRSSDYFCLAMRSRTVLGERASSVAGPPFSNSVSVCSAQSVVFFRSQLETDPFQIHIVTAG